MWEVSFKVDKNQHDLKTLTVFCYQQQSKNLNQIIEY